MRGKSPPRSRLAPVYGPTQFFRCPLCGALRPRNAPGLIHRLNHGLYHKKPQTMPNDDTDVCGFSHRTSLISENQHMAQSAAPLICGCRRIPFADTNVCHFDLIRYIAASVVPRNLPAAAFFSPAGRFLFSFSVNRLPFALGWL